ncbi:MAG: hypothetical protein ACR2OE_14965 [Thermomicrobiales bacterium]
MSAENTERQSIGRPYLTPEEVFIRVAELSCVANVSAASIRAVKLESETVMQATVAITWESPLHSFPRGFEFTAFGHTIEEAFENLAQMVDDWRVLQTINIPALYRDGAQFFMPETKRDEDES